ELAIEWSYSTGRHDEKTIRRLADELVIALREVAVHCGQPSAGGRTPSDYPLVRLDQATVDRLVGTGKHIEEIYPLTPMQAGMVFHSLSEPGVYVEQVTFQLDGVPDPQRLAEAWQQVVDQTPVLRTRVVGAGTAGPVQMVDRAVRVP